MAEKNMNAKISVEFEETTNRQQLSSGDNLPILFGKIKKFFADLKPVALSGDYADLNNTPTSVDGYGITDVYTKTEINTDYALKTEVSTAEQNAKDYADSLIGEAVTDEEIEALFT